MDGKENPNAGWMRLYQLIACAGVVLALIPATEFLALFCARQYAGVLAWMTVPVLAALGYGVQKLFLIGWRAGEMDFSFESHTEFPPLGRRIPAWGISALIGLLAGAGVRDLMAWRLGAESNSEVGGAVVMVTFAALGVAGCLMVLFRFFQMLSRRTLPGFACVFALILGVELFLKDGGPSVTLFLSVVLWFLCFALAANQEYVIKYAYASHTCVVSSRVRRAGLRNAMRVWLTAVGIFLPAAGLLTVAVTGIRMLALSGEGAPPAKLFLFPFAGAWGLNAVLFGFGILCMVFGAGVLLYRFAHDPARTRTGNLRQEAAGARAGRGRGDRALPRHRDKGSPRPAERALPRQPRTGACPAAGEGDRREILPCLPRPACGAGGGRHRAEPDNDARRGGRSDPGEDRAVAD